MTYRPYTPMNAVAEDRGDEQPMPGMFETCAYFCCAGLVALVLVGALVVGVYAVVGG